jgi:hypothetical protein
MYFRLDTARYLSTLQPAATVAPTDVPIPTRAPPFSVTDAQGVYRNLGYGPDITLCAPSTSTASQANCTVLLSELNSTFPTLLTPADLVWRWGRLGADYVALTHWGGTLFNVTAWRAIVRRFCLIL